ncbi:MAG: hypothetical protein U1E65_35125 [Myxococcota bacterium]
MPRAARLALLCLPLFGSLPGPAQAIGVEAHLGLAVTFWNFNSGNTGDGALLKFDTSMDPFVMRVLEIRVRDLYGVELGLNYLTSKLLGFAGFSSEQDFAGKDPVSSVLGGNLAYNIGVLRIGFNSTWKRFEGSRTFSGAFLGGDAPYFPLDGSAATPLKVGETAKWSTASNELAINLGLNAHHVLEDGETPSAQDADGMVIYAGYHRLSYQAPIAIDMFAVNDGPFAEFLMGVDVTSNLVELGLQWESTATPEDNWGFFFKLPLLIGQTTLSTPYFSGGAGMTMGLSIEAAISYAERIGPVVLALRAGVFGTWFQASSTIIEDVDAVPIVRDLLYKEGGDTNGFLKGQKITYTTSREETFWGPYLTLDVRI